MHCDSQVKNRHQTFVIYKKIKEVEILENLNLEKLCCNNVFIILTNTLYPIKFFKFHQLTFPKIIKETLFNIHKCPLSMEYLCLSVFLSFLIL